MPTEALVLAIARSAERLLSDALFGVSLVLGWNLFRVGVINDQQAELSGKGWKFRLQRVGPGVFFALFGAVGLVVALQRPLLETAGRPELQTNVGTGAAASSGYELSYYYYGPSSNDTAEYISALTTVEDVGIRDDGTHSAEHDALLRAKPILERHRQDLLRTIYPQYEWYLRVKSGGTVEIDRLSPEQRKTYQDLDDAVHKTLIE